MSVLDREADAHRLARAAHAVILSGRINAAGERTAISGPRYGSRSFRVLPLCRIGPTRVTARSETNIVDTF